ncbi:unnamed protein product, partial [Rotaria sp. Silwood1]
MASSNGFRNWYSDKKYSVESARLLMKMANIYYNCSAIITSHLHPDENCLYEPTYYTKLILVLFSFLAMIENLVRRDQDIGPSLKNYMISTKLKAISLKQVLPQLALPERKWFELVKKIDEHFELSSTNVKRTRKTDKFLFEEDSINLNNHSNENSTDVINLNMLDTCVEKSKYQWKKDKEMGTYVKDCYTFSPLKGRIFKNGNPVLCLPDVIVNHSHYKECFGTQNFLIYVAEKEKFGKEVRYYQTRNREFINARVYLLKDDQKQDCEPVMIFLPRLNLKFKLDGTKVISEDFKDYRLSQDQHINTLSGLSQYLIIEPDIQSDNLIKFNRKLIIPYHPIKKKESFFSNTIEFNLKKVGKPAYFSYEIDENLEWLNSETIAGSLYLALLYFKTATLDKDLFLKLNSYEICAEILKTCWQNCQYSDAEFNIILNFFENTCPDLEKPWSTYAGSEKKMFTIDNYGSYPHHRNTHAILLRLIYLLLSSYQTDFMIKIDDSRKTLYHHFLYNNLVKYHFNFYLIFKDRIDKRCRLSHEEEKKLLSSCVTKHSNSRISDYYKIALSLESTGEFNTESFSYFLTYLFLRASRQEKEYRWERLDDDEAFIRMLYVVSIFPKEFNPLPEFLLTEKNEIDYNRQYRFDSDMMKMIGDDFLLNYNHNDIVNKETKEKPIGITSDLSNKMHENIIKNRNKALYEFIVDISERCEKIVKSQNIGYIVSNTTGISNFKITLSVKDIDSQLSKKYSYSEIHDNNRSNLDWQVESINTREHYENLKKLFDIKFHYPENINFPLDCDTLPENSLVKEVFSKGYGKAFISDLKESYGQQSSIVEFKEKYFYYSMKEPRKGIDILKELIGDYKKANDYILSNLNEIKIELSVVVDQWVKDDISRKYISESERDDIRKMNIEHENKCQEINNALIQRNILKKPLPLESLQKLLEKYKNDANLKKDVKTWVRNVEDILEEKEDFILKHDHLFNSYLNCCYEENIVDPIVLKFLYQSTQLKTERAQKLELLYSIDKFKFFDILDESDEILSHGKELNYTLGATKSLDGGSIRWEIPFLLFRIIFCEKEFGQFLEKASQLDDCPVVFQRDFRPVSGIGGGSPLVRFVKHEYFQRNIKPKLCQEICKIILQNFCEKQTSIMNDEGECYGSYEEFIEGKCLFKEDKIIKLLKRKSVDMLNSFLLAKGWLSHELLYHVISYRYRVEYGLSEKSEKEIAIPFRGKDLPSENSEFSHPDIMIGFTILSYLYRGLDLKQVKDGLIKLKSDQKRDKNMLLQTCVKENEEWINEHIKKENEEFPLWLKSFKTLDLENENSIKKAHLYLSRNFSFIEYYLSNFAFPNDTKYFEKKITGNAHTLAGEGKNNGFSGTDDRNDTMPESIVSKRLYSQLGTNGKMLHILSRKINQKYETKVDVSNTVKFLDEVCRYAQNDKDCYILIDSGAIITEMTNMDVSKYLIKNIDKRFDGIVYFSDNNSKIMVILRREECVPLSACHIDNKKLFVYLDEAHTRGTDLKLPLTARGVVTLGKNMNKDKLMQAVMRIRDLDFKQSIVIWGLKEMSAEIAIINGIKLDEITSKHVLTWVTYNTIRKNENDLYPVTKEKLKYVIKGRALEYQKKIKEIPMDSLIVAYVSENIDSIENSYGTTPRERNPRDLLNKNMGTYLSEFYPFVKSELENKETYSHFIKELNEHWNDIDRPKMKKIIEKVDKKLPNDILTTNADYNCEQENAREIEEIQHVELASELKNTPSIEIAWDFPKVFEQNFKQNVFKEGSGYPKLKSLKQYFVLTDMNDWRNLKWHSQIFATENFIKTIEAIDAK